MEIQPTRDYDARSKPKFTSGQTQTCLPVSGRGRKRVRHERYSPMWIGNGDEPKPGFPAHPGAKFRETTRTLVRCDSFNSQPHVPVPLRSAVVTRFPATKRTPPPTSPFAASRGSLIHVTWTSKYSVSNHLKLPTRCAPLPLRWPLYFVRALPFRSQARQNHRPNRVHLTSISNG